MQSNNKTNKRFGSFSIDVDTLEADLTNGKGKNHNIKQSELSEVSYTRFLPRFLDLCDKHNVKATFFIIGKHALNKTNRRLIRTISDNDHEIANHTMNHFKHFAHLSEKEIEEEIAESDKILSNITGKAVVGFKAPGFVVNKNIFRVLTERGYSYDASLLPSFVYNVVKMFLKISMFKDDMNIQNLKLCFAPTVPFHPNSRKIGKASFNHKFLEIPVNVIPFIRFPFVNYIFAFFNYRFINSCYSVIRKSKQVLNYSFHDLEFADSSDFQKIGNIADTFLFTRKIIKKDWDERVHQVENIFLSFGDDHRLVPLKDLASSIANR